MSTKTIIYTAAWYEGHDDCLEAAKRDAIASVANRWSAMSSSAEARWGSECDGEDADQRNVIVVELAGLSEEN